MLARLLERSLRWPRVWLAVAIGLMLMGAALDRSSSPAFFLGLGGMAVLGWAMVALVDEAVR